MDMFLGLTKLHEEERIILARAVCEEPDRSNEVVDYVRAVEAFKKWSGEMSDASGGKSLGNVRIMHQPRVAGRVVDVFYKDDEKAIDVAIKVDDPQVWEMCKSGAYTGLSIGGAYGDKWADPTNPLLTRYAPKLSELSIVDRPCIPSSTFQVLKADGTTVERHFSLRPTFGALFKKRPEVDADLIAGLRQRVAAHNETHGEMWQKTKLGVLKKVWERGASRGDASGAMRRVEGFLESLSGRSLRKSGDFDLLPAGHPGREKPKTFGELYKADSRGKSSAGDHAGAAVTGLGYGYVARKITGPVMTPVTATLMGASPRFRRAVNTANDAAVGVGRGLKMAMRSNRPGLVGDAMRHAVKTGKAKDAAAGAVGRTARSLRGTWRVPGIAGGATVGYMAYRRDLSRRKAAGDPMKVQVVKADEGDDLKKAGMGSVISRLGTAPFPKAERAMLAGLAAAGGAIGGAIGHKGNPYRDENGRYTSKDKAAYVVGGGAIAGAAIALGGGVALTNYGVKRLVSEARNKLMNNPGNPIRVKLTDGIQTSSGWVKTPGPAGATVTSERVSVRALAAAKAEFADFVGDGRTARAIKRSMDKAGADLLDMKAKFADIASIDEFEFGYRNKAGIGLTTKLNKQQLADKADYVKEFEGVTDALKTKHGMIERALDGADLTPADILKGYKRDRLAGLPHDKALKAAASMVDDLGLDEIKLRNAKQSIPGYIEAKLKVEFSDGLKEKLKAEKEAAKKLMDAASEKAKIAAAFIGSDGSDLVRIWNKHLSTKGNLVPKDVRDFRKTGAPKLIEDAVKVITKEEADVEANMAARIATMDNVVGAAARDFDAAAKKTMDAYLSTKIAGKVSRMTAPARAEMKDVAGQVRDAAKLLRRGVLGPGSKVGSTIAGAKAGAESAFRRAFMKEGKFWTQPKQNSLIPVSLPNFSGKKLATWAALSTLGGTAFAHKDENGKWVLDSPKNVDIKFGGTNDKGKMEFAAIYESRRRPGERRYLFGFDLDPHEIDNPNFKLPGLEYRGGQKRDGERGVRPEGVKGDDVKYWNENANKGGVIRTGNPDSGDAVSYRRHDIAEKRLSDAGRQVGNQLRDTFSKAITEFNRSREAGEVEATDDDLFSTVGEITGQKTALDVAGVKLPTNAMTAHQKANLIAALMPNDQEFQVSMAQTRDKDPKLKGDAQRKVSKALERAIEDLPPIDTDDRKKWMRGAVHIFKAGNFIDQKQHGDLLRRINNTASSRSDDARDSDAGDSGDDFTDWLRSKGLSGSDDLDALRRVWRAEMGKVDRFDGKLLRKGAIASAAMAADASEKKGKPTAAYYGALAGAAAGFELGSGTGNSWLKQARTVANPTKSQRVGNVMRGLSRSAKVGAGGLAGAVALGYAGQKLGENRDRAKSRESITNPSDTGRGTVGRLGGGFIGGMYGGAKVGAMAGRKFGAVGAAVGAAAGSAIGSVAGDYGGAKAGNAWDRYSKRTRSRVKGDA